MSLFVSLLALSVAACGGDDDDDMAGPDAPPAKVCDFNGGADCFEAPDTAMTKAAGGAANFNCAAPTITMSSGAVTVSGTVEDFQTGDPVSGATVMASKDLTFDDNDDVMTTSATDGTYSITLPQGTPSRMNWRTTADGALPTFGLNAPLDVSMATVTQDRSSVSELTANALPAFIGVTRTEGLGVLAGTVEDCDGDLVVGAIATVSTTSSVGNATPTFVEGAQVYYFSDNDLPVKRSTRTYTNTNGLFVIIEIPPTSGSQRYFLQVWGFTSDADVAQGEAGLKLISEFEAPVVGDAVISITMDPTEGPIQ